MSEEHETLTGLLDDWAAALSVAGQHAAVASLQAGLDRAAVEAALHGAGLVPDPGLVELYAWHDGSSIDDDTVLDDVHVFPGFFFPPLAEALEDRRHHGTTWDRRWWPVLANGAGDFYVVEVGTDYGGVRHIRYEEAEHPVEFASLHALVGTVVEALRRGVIALDADGYLEMDDVAYAAVARELNPTIAEWIGWH